MVEKALKSSKKMKKAKKSATVVERMNEEVDVMTGKLMETAGVMHTFMQSLQSSGFKEYVDYLGRPYYSFFFNLMVGVARGFGFVIGATVVVALFVYVMTRYLVDLPVIGEFFQFIQGVITDPELQKGLESGQLGDSLNEMFENFKTNVL